jgi:ADP-ribose pyrophosphatase YjhB (NUDIX family)
LRLRSRRRTLPGMAAPPPPGRFERRVPAGDDRERLVCTDCGFVAYENPKVIVGAVVHDGDRVLMCRRSIPPREGFWTLPAGHLEIGETPEDGVRREAWEEARARLDVELLLSVYTIFQPAQVQLIYRARLADPHVEAGPESHEVALYRWDEIPWDAIAFPSVRWALHDYAATRGRHGFPPHGNPPGVDARDVP